MAADARRVSITDTMRSTRPRRAHRTSKRLMQGAVCLRKRRSSRRLANFADVPSTAESPAAAQGRRPRQRQGVGIAGKLGDRKQAARAQHGATDAMRAAGSGTPPRTANEPRRRRVSDPSAGSPGDCGNSEWPLGKQRAATLAQGLERRLVQGPRVRAGGPDAERERLPPFLEACVLAHAGDLPRLDVAQPRRREHLGEVPLAGARQVRFVLDAGSSCRAARQNGESGARPPPKSQTHAATTPSGRVTRAISATPATGSAMKCTTSCASAASKASSGNGSSSAAASGSGQTPPASCVGDGLSTGPSWRAPAVRLGRRRSVGRLAARWAVRPLCRAG